MRRNPACGILFQTNTSDKELFERRIVRNMNLKGQNVNRAENGAEKRQYGQNDYIHR